MFAQGLRKQGSLRDETRFECWIIRILVNECRSLRRRRHQTCSFDEAIGEDCPVPQAQELGLRDALQCLPERLRLPLLLHHMEGYSLEEVARMLHLPYSTVRGRVFEARRRLRCELEKEKMQ